MSGDDDPGDCGASAIVAYEATRRGWPSNVLVFTNVQVNIRWMIGWVVFCFCFFLQKMIRRITRVDPPSTNKITIVWGRGTQLQQFKTITNGFQKFQQITIFFKTRTTLTIKKKTYSSIVILATQENEASSLPD